MIFTIISNYSSSYTESKRSNHVPDKTVGCNGI